MSVCLSLPVSAQLEVFGGTEEDKQLTGCEKFGTAASLPLQSQSSGIRIPLELFEAIILDVDSPGDLLSLALACRTLHTLIVPNHVDFRFIQCTPGRKKLWSFLGENPRYASRIREIKLINEFFAKPSPKVPTMFSDEEPEQGSRLNNWDQTLYPDISQLIPSLSKMVNLLKFSWELGLVSRDDLTARLQIGEAIRTSGCNLSGISGYMDSNADFHIQVMPQLHELAIEPLWNLPGHCLRQFTLVIKFSPPEEITHYFPDILFVSYPALTELAIYLDYESVTEELLDFRFLRKANWSNLKKFTLALLASPRGARGGDPSYERTEKRAQIMTSFLGRHPNLECLKFDGYDSLFSNATCFTPQNVLSRLRSLSIALTTLSSISILPLEVGRQIQHLKITITEECLAFFGVLTNLRSCQVSLKPDILMKFLQIVPFVEKLRLNCAEGYLLNSIRNRASLREFSLKERALPSLRNLKYLGGPMFWATYSPKAVLLDEADEAFLEALSTLTSIRYVEINSWRETWTEIKRGANGRYHGHHEFLERGISANSWGEFAI